MKAILITALFALGGFGALYAQSPQYSIFESLERQPKAGEGGVVIHQPDAIRRLVGTRIDSDNIDAVSGKSFIKTMGYRVQVYSGNNQRVSKEEVQTIKKKIEEIYPGVDTYPIFEAPFWKLHVGNYLTFEEASIMLRELRKTFAQRKNEIFILEDEIRLPLD
jgi:hypothetical protein